MDSRTCSLVMSLITDCFLILSNVIELSVTEAFVVTYPGVGQQVLVLKSRRELFSWDLLELVHPNSIVVLRLIASTTSL